LAFTLERLSLSGHASLRWSHFLPAFEHTPLALPKNAFLTGDGAKSDALDAPRKFHDPDLLEIITAWPTLPEHVKSAILKMIKRAK